MRVNILGTEYEIVIGNEEDYPRYRKYTKRLKR